MTSQGLKKHGFLAQKQEGIYFLRLRSIAGNLTARQLEAVADLAQKYGNGEVHLTTRQGVEIHWIKAEDCPAVIEEVQQLGLTIGASGPRIRTIVACPGNDVCKSAVMPTKAVAATLDKAFFGRDVPMKTKIAISGCANSCAKPQENDFGYMGAVEPVLLTDSCTGCGICAVECPARALTMENNLPVRDEDKCLHEGQCIRVCPFAAWQPGKMGYHVYAGGKIGRFPRLGKRIDCFVPLEKLVQAGEAVLKAFQHLQEGKERISDTLARVGEDKFIEEYRKHIK